MERRPQAIDQLAAAHTYCDPETMLSTIADCVSDALNTQKVINSFDSIHGKRVAREQLICDLGKIAHATDSAVRYATADGVLADEVSRVEAGRILGVHQGTVARWVNEERQHRSGQAS